MKDKEKEHHIWCSFFERPREGCQMCERLYKEYPMKEGETGEDLMKKHFPNNIIRK